MTIASTLFNCLDAQTEIIPWEKVDSVWQAKITGAMATEAPPEYLLFPATQDSLARIVKWANQNCSRVLICGQGTKLDWGGLVDSPRLVVSTHKLNRLIEHAAGDLTVTVEAGVTLKTLKAQLTPYGQFLPLDPAYPDAATLGGIVATADSGFWRQRYGGTRDLVLGITFVRADGEIARAGGRVVKNVAGYDLMKLFTGSYGTLGIITQITLRLYPVQAATATIVLSGEPSAISQLVKTLRATSLTPTAAEVISTKLVQDLELGEGIGLVIRCESLAKSVEAQISQIRAFGESLGLQTTEYLSAKESNLWQQLQERITIAANSPCIIGKIGIIPNQMVDFLALMHSQTQGLAMINLGTGLGKFKAAITVSQIEEMRSLLNAAQGFLTVLSAPKAVKKQLEPWGYQGNTLELMRQLKAKFDPNYILNPARFVGGI